MGWLMSEHRATFGNRLRWLLTLAWVALALAACTAAPGISTPTPASPTGALTVVPPTTPATVTPAATSTSAPATGTTAPATATPVATGTTAPASATPAPTPPPTASIGSEILFLRNNTLIAYDLVTGQERQLTSDVLDFAATPDGRQLALLRSTGGSSEIWLLGRDGSGLRQLTSNNRNEGSISWAPDGLTLAYASSSAPLTRPLDWQSWANWCSASELRLLNIARGSEQTLAPGCDPAFSPDGRRIAFATPPTQSTTGSSPDSVNTIRLVNRQGQNGWNFATADNSPANPDSGLLVYAPAWSPDSAQLAYHRFIGYRALVDIDYTEMGGSFEGKGKLLSSGAGWLLAPRFAPDGRSMLIVEHNFSDARGLSGYEIWETQVLRLGVPGEVVLPDGTRPTNAAVVDKLGHTTGAVWSPDGSGLVVALPNEWSAETPPDEPIYTNSDPGSLWRWQPGTAPSERLVQGVDFASPLAWLPPLPRSASSDQGYRLVYPADWQLDAPSEFEELTARAPDNVRLISAAPLPSGDPATLDAAAAFALFVAPGAQMEAPITWPDGSIYRGFTGTTPDGVAIAGAIRSFTTTSGTTIALLYRSTPQLWPLERARAQALLAAGGSP